MTSVVNDGLVGYISKVIYVSAADCESDKAGKSISLNIKVPQAVSFFSVLL